MSYHILHLLSHNLRVRLKLDQLHITDTEKGAERTLPLADVAIIVAAAPDLSLTAGALRRMSELNVLMLICNERFEPCCLTLPYYRATNTELLRRQIEWTADWKETLWRQIIVSKIRNQATVLRCVDRIHEKLLEIADRCEKSPVGVESRNSSRPARPSLATITASRRYEFLLDSPTACESRAAQYYWKNFLPLLSAYETRRKPRTRQGVNGMLDYGYAIVRTAVLRSLAAHGFVAAIGVHHAIKANSFALADDLMEPLRPWVDWALYRFLQGEQESTKEMKEWIPQAAQILMTPVQMGRSKIRFIHAIDLYIQSVAQATLSRRNHPLKIPMLT